MYTILQYSTHTPVFLPPFNFVINASSRSRRSGGAVAQQNGLQLLLTSLAAAANRKPENWTTAHTHTHTHGQTRGCTVHFFVLFLNIFTVIDMCRTRRHWIQEIVNNSFKKLSLVNGSIDLTKQQSIGSIDLKSSTKEPWLLVNGTIDCREQYKRPFVHGSIDCR